MPQRLAFQQLHGNEGAPVVFINVVDGADVRVIQRRGGPRFALEPLEGLTVLGKVLRQELERYQAAELGVLGLVDDAHASPAQLLENAIVGDRLAGHKGKGLERSS